MTDKALRKEEIIRAAIEVFGRNGFQNSSISEIAQKANVAEGTIYQYFKNKEDLFFSIPEERSKEFCKQLDLHFQGITGSVNKIGKLVWYYLYFFQTNPDYARTLMLEMRVSKSFLKSTTCGSLKEFTDKVLGLLQEAQEEGVIRKGAHLYLCRQLVLGFLEHVVTRWLLKEEKYDLAADHKEITDLIMNGIFHVRGRPGLVGEGTSLS